MYHPHILNTLREALPEAFWPALREHLLRLQQQGTRLPDTFWQFDQSWDASWLKDEAFHPDHAEHLGAWVYDSNSWPVFEQFKITGYFAKADESGRHYSGIYFVDGHPHDAVIEIRVRPGHQLETVKK